MRNRRVKKYIIFSIVLYIIGTIICISYPTGGGSEMFSGFDEAIRIFLTLLIGISISELIGGIYLLTKNLPKSVLKKALISFFALIIVLFVISYPFSWILIIFIIPTSSIIINCVIENKKHNKLVWIIIFILIILRILWQIGDYIYFKREQSKNTEYACKNYITSNSSNFYCFSIDQIKKINKNNLDKKIYKNANYLFYDDPIQSSNFIDDAGNNNYIYYTIYKENYGSTYADYELHVIDINNNTDTNIINLKKEIIVSAITDENGNLFFITKNFNNKIKSYYYQTSKNIFTKIKNTDDLDFYYLKNHKLYYRISNEDTIHFYSYDIKNNKKTDNGYMENESNIIPNSVFITIDNYRYQFYNQEIYKYDINDYSKKITIKTNSEYRVNDIKFNNNKIYYFHINNENSVLLGYYDISNNLITDINYDFKSTNKNFIIKNDIFYYINKNDNHLYKCNLKNNIIKKFISTEVNTILGIDMDTIYLKTKVNDYEAINLDTKKTIFLES